MNFHNIGNACWEFYLRQGGSLIEILVPLIYSRGYLLDEDGFDYVKLSVLREIKVQQRSLREYVKTYPRAKYFDDAKPWSERCDIAFPCATQNELNHADALNLVNSGCRILIEGSNMPCTAEAVDVLRKSKVLVGPAKAANAGGVGVAELEANQDGNLIHWSPEEFENKLQSGFLLPGASSSIYLVRAPPTGSVLPPLPGADSSPFWWVLPSACSSVSTPCVHVRVLVSCLYPRVLTSLHPERPHVPLPRAGSSNYDSSVFLEVEFQGTGKKRAEQRRGQRDRGQRRTSLLWVTLENSDFSTGKQISATPWCGFLLPSVSSSICLVWAPSISSILPPLPSADSSPFWWVLSSAGSYGRHVAKPLVRAPLIAYLKMTDDIQANMAKIVEENMQLSSSLKDATSTIRKLEDKLNGLKTQPPINIPDSLQAKMSDMKTKEVEILSL
eukprot:Gb_05715 [translate_table: standard]